MEIKIEIKDCSDCPHHKATPYYTADSFERPEYWWCSMDDKKLDDEEDEKHRQSIMKNSGLKKLRKIAGYVEWHDKTPIPEWCPCKVDTMNDKSWHRTMKQIKKSK